MKTLSLSWMIAIASASMIVGCGSPSRSDDQGAANSAIAVVAPADVIPPDPQPAYVPNFDDRDGDTYFYTSAASEEDRKKGKVLGSVSSFQYLGKQDGKHIIATVTESGQAMFTYECADPCRIIKRITGGDVERIPYDPHSVIGAAFEDAMNGGLQAARPKRSKTVASVPETDTIPAAFVGEWNATVEDCGTGNNDSRLRVEPKRLRFYESDGEVRSVDKASARAIRITASFAGEGQAWTNNVEFVLSRSGDDLSSGDVVRHRCPA